MKKRLYGAGIRNGNVGSNVVTEVRKTPLRGKYLKKGITPLKGQTSKYLKKGITPLKGQTSKYHEPRGDN